MKTHYISSRLCVVRNATRFLERQCLPACPVGLTHPQPSSSVCNALAMSHINQTNLSRSEVQAPEALLASVGRLFAIQCSVCAGIAVGGCPSVSSIHVVIRPRGVIRVVLLVLGFMAFLNGWSLSETLGYVMFGSDTWNQIEQEA